MKNYYIGCIREHVHRDGESEYFKFGHSNDVDLQTISMRTTRSRTFKTIFVLGPFLDRDEAVHVESQAHSLVAAYHVKGEWFDVNPLELAEFWEWVDAQILPICVSKRNAFLRQPSRRGRMDRRPTVAPRHSADEEEGASDLLEEVRS